MRRRDFLGVIGGAALCAAPARAQQQAVPVIGFLHSGFPGPFESHIALFRQVLGDAGYFEGQNVVIDYRWAEDQSARLPILADDLVRRGVILIVSSTSAASVAAKMATNTIPIVFEMGGDPVRAGLVSSFNRPGGNATGITQFTGTLEPKRLELLREMVPSAVTFGVLINPTRPGVESQVSDVQDAGRALGLKMVVLNARNEQEIDAAFAELRQQRVAGLLVAADPFFHSRSEQLVALSTRHAVPAIYQWREHAVIGGLMSYGTNLSESFRQLAVYVARVLKGEKPADLPVVRSTKVELVINLKTAKALGVSVPLTLLGRADEVIE